MLNVYAKHVSDQSFGSGGSRLLVSGDNFKLISSTVPITIIFYTVANVEIVRLESITRGAVNFKDLKDAEQDYFDYVVISCPTGTATPDMIFSSGVDLAGVVADNVYTASYALTPLVPNNIVGTPLLTTLRATASGQSVPGYCESITVVASIANTGVVWVGNDGSVGATAGIPLYPGDSIEIVNNSDVPVKFENLTDTLYRFGQGYIPFVVVPP